MTATAPASRPLQLDNATAERLARIEASIEQTQRDVAEMRAFLESAVEDLKDGGERRQAQITAIDRTCAARSVGSDNLTKKVDDHERRLSEVEKLMPALRFVMWVGGAVGLAIIGLIISLITGQVQMVFP